MNIDIAISLLIIINVLKLVAGMEKCNVCYCETGKFGMSDIRWLYRTKISILLKVAKTNLICQLFIIIFDIKYF